jgi:WD40 repeat protein
MCYSSCFSMDTTNEDNLVVSGHLDGTLRLWSVITGQLVHQIKDLHDGLITSVSISNDNQYVLTNSQY